MRFLLFLFFCISTMTVFSQPVKAIVEENRVWSTLEIHCLPNGNNYSTYHIKFEEDTIIEGFNYKRMWQSDDQALSEWSLYGFVREDENKRVYLRPLNYFEGMVYDFGCAVGDTINTWNIYLNSDSLHFVVTNIDSVLLYDGFKKRITLFEYDNLLEEVWVEGLGSYFGILNSGNNAYGGVCGSNQALCYENDGSLIYQNPDYNTCYYSVTVNLDQHISGQINYYPNPAKDFVNINLADEGTKEIQLVDLNGKIILKKITVDNKVLLNLQEVNKGIYFVRIKTDNIYYLPGKLIVD